MDLNDILKLIDEDMVQEIKLYYKGHCSTYDLKEWNGVPEFMPDGRVVTKIWASEDGKGISIVTRDKN